MIGIVIVTHGNLGKEMVKTAEFILGGIDGCATVSVDGERNPDLLREAIAQAIKSVDRQAGVLVLTDMFGGTPSNLSLSFLKERQLEVLSGVNLPMLMKAVQLRDNNSLTEAAQTIGDYARKSINVAGEILNGR